jgi:MoxR-like ATPase
MSAQVEDMTLIGQSFQRLRDRVGEVVVGQDAALRQVCLTLLCGGHSLIEGVPGVAKTLLVKTLARALALRFGRVQFTPDLMPSDIIGTSIFDARDAQVRFRHGPLFTDLLLADEINRASAKTQAALLEAMQERSATVDGVRHPLGENFVVFATQNPIEHEGTYPLPEAQLDRFLFKIVIDYPTEQEEREILLRHHVEVPVSDSIATVLDPDLLLQTRQLVHRVIVGDAIFDYVNTLIRATRSDANFVLGASPRAGVWLLRAAKANAAMEGRDFVLPEDVQEMWPATLRHRVRLDASAEVEGMRVDEALAHVLRGIPVPR